MSLLGGLVSGIGSFFGAKSQADAASDAHKDQIKALKEAAEQLTASFDDIISKVQQSPGAYAGTKVEGVPYQPINIRDTQAEAVSANQANLDDILGLVGRTNRSTIANDLARINTLLPGASQTMGQIAQTAGTLASGQLPFDTVQDIISDRAGMSAAAGIPGGAAPATLRDLGLSSLEATQQGQSMFQSIMQAADQFVSPVSRQTAAPQFFSTPQETTQLGFNQAQLQQQSGQNVANLAGQPDPGANLLMQLQLQQAMGAAGTQAQVAGIGSPVFPSTMGLASQTLLPSIANAFSGSGGGGGFSSGFGGFNAQAYNQQAQAFNAANPTGIPKAIVVS